MRTLAPQLLPGQKMSRNEFLRRWEELPDVKNAELIDGVVYMASPVSNRHSTSDALIHGWLTVYVAETPGCQAGCNGTWLMEESAPQPDSNLRILPEHGGQSSNDGKYCVGAPELVVEVCRSSATHDFGPKLPLYQRAGVREYMTLALESREVVWRELIGGRYTPLTPGNDGTLRSKVFPGLWLDPEALLTGDAARLFERLRAGSESSEHADFIASLKR